MAIILKSKTSFSGNSIYPAGFLEYVQRVSENGGVIENVDAVFEVYRQLEKLEIPLSKIKALISPDFGCQINTDGLVLKAFNLSNQNDFSLVGTRAGTGPFLSTENGIREFVFNDMPGAGQRTLSGSFVETPFTFTSIISSAQVRFDDVNASPNRTIIFFNHDSNSVPGGRGIDPLLVEPTKKFDQVSNGSSNVFAGNYRGRTFYSAKSESISETHINRRITNDRAVIHGQYTTLGYFPPNTGFNGNIYAYSGNGVSYNQTTGYGLGAILVAIDITDEQLFGLQDTISKVTN